MFGRFVTMADQMGSTVIKIGYLQTKQNSILF